MAWCAAAYRSDFIDFTLYKSFYCRSASVRLIFIIMNLSLFRVFPAIYLNETYRCQLFVRLCSLYKLLCSSKPANTALQGILGVEDTSTEHEHSIIRSFISLINEH